MAACDPNCLNCSSSNPQVCIICGLGMYMVTGQTYCLPCAGNCVSCNASATAQCYSCDSDSFLNTTDNTCVSCTFPCSSCTSNSATTCSSCVQGYVLIGTACTIDSSVTNALSNCAN